MSDDLERLLRNLEAADERISVESARLLIGAAGDLVAHAKSIAHRQSGNMGDTIHRLGPFPVGNGALEARIESGAWYADLEVAKGGDHDWALRTVQERDDLIRELEAALADAVVRVVVG